MHMHGRGSMMFARLCFFVSRHHNWYCFPKKPLIINLSNHKYACPVVEKVCFSVRYPFYQFYAWYFSRIWKIPICYQIINNLRAGPAPCQHLLWISTRAKARIDQALLCWQACMLVFNIYCKELCHELPSYSTNSNFLNFNLESKVKVNCAPMGVLHCSICSLFRFVVYPWVYSLTWYLDKRFCVTRQTFSVHVYHLS
jgi:hypothetical protein